MNQESSKVVKRPFLRRGQGLIKYKLQPEDLKQPYRNVYSKQNTIHNKRAYQKPSAISARHQVSSNTFKDTKPVTNGQ